MKTNILFYGNRQTKHIFDIINLSDNYNTSHIFCGSTELDKESFTEIIKNQDIIITQPLKEGYRNVDYLSLDYILQHKKPTCKVIIFNCLKFSFYYFDQIYIHASKNNITDHYRSMIECFEKGDTIDYYLANYVYNVDLKTSAELEVIANHSLNEIYERDLITKEKYESDNVYVIPTFNFIKENYKDKLLFYTDSVPTRHMIQYICECILNISQIPNTINYNMDILFCTKSILYKCIQKNVNFNIEDNIPTLKNVIGDFYKIVELYYDTYREYGIPQLK